MGFDQSSITSVSKPTWRAGQLYLSWTSTAPAGTWYQVYFARKLTWYGRETRCSIPTPPGQGRFQIGTVSDGEQQTDFSASLPAAPANRVRLSWTGGSFEGSDLSSFRIYGESSPGSGVDYAAPLGEVSAHPGGIVLDGWNMGGWNQGGWGSSPGTYAWTSGPLRSGSWTFGVRPVDQAGNEGPTSEGTVAVAVPPGPPAAYADYSRLAYAYDQGTYRATLTWNPTPG